MDFLDVFVSRKIERVVVVVVVVVVVHAVLSRFLSFVWLFFSDFLIFLISLNWTHPKDDAGCGYYYLLFFQSERGDQNTPRRGKTL